MTDRPTASTITDAQLDELHAELERMKLLVAASSEPGHAVRMAAQYAEKAIENGERADRAEAALARITALHEQWVKAGPPPLGTPTARWWDRRLVELHNAIHPPTDQTTEQL
ncbi:MAG: hypothetical protein HOV82_16765 [Streptomyces sp.]|nr:hypothetical protein [Streptomyces sp.]NUP36173.1 hypothetical protein [Streptomyces sp.]NUS75520.1 hypothetical protein [Streptomyces sp.]